MKRILPLLLLGLMLTGALQLPAKGKPFFFIQLTDTQLGFYNENKEFGQEAAQVEQFVDAINRLRPAFVVVTGDLVNDRNNDSQLEGFRELFSRLDTKIPLYVIPGNHDIGNEAAAEDVEKYTERYGSDRFVVRHSGSSVIGINTTAIKAGTPEQEQQEYRWLERQLRKAKNDRQRIVAGHHPFFLGVPFEANVYNNIPLAVRGKYLDLFRRYRVGLVLAGHLHYCTGTRSLGTQFTVAGAAGRPLGKDKPGMQAIAVYPDRIETTFYGIEQIPESIALKTR